MLAAVRGAFVLLPATLAVGASTAAARTYRGVMTNGAGPVHSGEQGAIWRSRFVEHAKGRVAYSGHWVVKFFKLGRTLSSWRFTVRSEGV
jgi:hypothetical protein